MTSEVRAGKSRSEQTATERLRALLDERGVECGCVDEEPAWVGSDGRMYYARQEFTFAGLTDEVTVYHLTPEQAVAATLGPGTCKDVGIEGEWFECSECGMRHEGWALKRWARYCPNCGRRVVD